MQEAAIRAVKRFSSVSGLLLNLKKSAAISLGTHPGSNGEQNDTARNEKEMKALSSTDHSKHEIFRPSSWK